MKILKTIFVKNKIMEIWKDIDGYEELYQVSNHGRIKSLPKGDGIGKGNWFRKEKILKQTIDTSGYFFVGCRKNKRIKTINVHRLVGLAFIPNPDNKPQINHKDGNKLNNNDWNLEWATKSENQLHAFRIGLQKYSDKCGKPKQPIKVYNYYTGEFVGEYESQAECARQLNILGCSINSFFKGNQKRVKQYRFINN